MPNEKKNDRWDIVTVASIFHYLYSGCRSLNFKYTYPLKITKLKFYQNLSGVFCDNNVKTCTPDNRRTTKDNDRSICDSNDLENELWELYLFYIKYVYNNVRLYSINPITTNRTTAMDIAIIRYRPILFSSMEADVDGSIVVEEL